MDKILNFLGLAQNAGSLVSGEQAVEVTIRRGKVKLLIIATNASRNTTKKFISSSEYYQVPYLVFGEKEELGLAIGKPQRAVIAVVDSNFAQVIRSRIVESLEKN